MNKNSVVVLSIAFLSSLAATGCVAGAGESAPAEEARVGSAEEALITAGTYLVRNANSQELLNVFGASTRDSAPMIQWPASGGSNEQFSLAAASTGYWNITSFTGKCLGVFGGSGSVGIGVTQWACDSTQNQEFALVSAGTGLYQIKPKANGLCLTVYGDSTASGYAVVQEPCVTGKASQQWSFELP